MNRPRQHHHTPRAYLAHFTATGLNDGRLFVLDKQSGRVHASTPEKAGKQRDLYLLEKREDAPEDGQTVEIFFSQVEERYATVISGCLKSGVVPEAGDERTSLMLFLAAQMVRAPGSMRAWRDFNHKILRRVAWYLAKTREEREAVESGDLYFDLDKNSRLIPAVRQIPYLADCLGLRHWTLVRAAEGAPDFVTSDRAVTVCWTYSGRATFPPALGYPETTAMFSVSRRASLFGLFEQPFPHDLADSRLVGIVNNKTASFGTRFVYGPAEDFHVNISEELTGGWQAFLQSHRPPPPDPTVDWANRR